MRLKAANSSGANKNVLHLAVINGRRVQDNPPRVAFLSGRGTSPPGCTDLAPSATVSTKYVVPQIGRARLRLEGY